MTQRGSVIMVKIRDGEPAIQAAMKKRAAVYRVLSRAKKPLTHSQILQRTDGLVIGDIYAALPVLLADGDVERVDVAGFSQPRWRKATA